MNSAKEEQRNASNCLLNERYQTFIQFEVDNLVNASLSGILIRISQIT